MTTRAITHAHIVSMNPARQVIADGFVEIEDSRIRRLGDHAGETPAACDETLDAAGKVLLPGFVNAHTHVSQILLRGGPSHGRQLHDWLLNVLYPGQKAMTPDDVAVANRLYCAEAVRSGITTINDNVDSALYPGNVEAGMEAYERCGVRAIYARMFLDRPDDAMGPYLAAVAARAPGVEAVDLFEELAAIKRQLEDIAARHHGSANGRITVWPAPAVTAVTSVEALRWSQDFARDLGVMWTLHLAETEHEERVHWMSPTEYLDCHGLLSDHLQVAHCVCFSAKDVRLLKRYDVRVSSQVGSNGYLGAGVAPVPDMLQRGITVGIGTDDANCNDSVNLLGDMKLMSHVHRALHADADVITPEKILEMATIDGARSVGLDAEIGSIEQGKKADLILVDLDHFHTTPHPNVPAALVFQTYGNEVDTVMIDGEYVMTGRQLSFIAAADEARFRAEARERAAAVCERAKLVSDPPWRSL